jgi:hypothetical protein
MMRIRYGLVVTLAGCFGLAGCGGGSSSSSSIPSATSSLYVATQANTVVTELAINLNDGTLSGGKATAPTGSAPVAIAMTPTKTSAGTLAFVANNVCANGNSNCNSISRYSQ